MKEQEYPNTIKSKQDGFEIHLNYSEDAETTGKVKIVPTKVQDIELNIDGFLEMIATYVKNKPMAIALHDAEMNQILMTEVEREFTFTADKDYKTGEVVKFRVTNAYPAILAALEQEYQLCRMKGGAFTTLDKDRVDAAIMRLKNKNIEFLKKMYNMGTDTKGLIPDEKKDEAEEESKE